MINETGSQSQEKALKNEAIARALIILARDKRYVIVGTKQINPETVAEYFSKASNPMVLDYNAVDTSKVRIDLEGKNLLVITNYQNVATQRTLDWQVFVSDAAMDHRGLNILVMSNDDVTSDYLTGPWANGPFGDRTKSLYTLDASGKDVKLSPVHQPGVINTKPYPAESNDQPSAGQSSTQTWQ